MGCPVRDFDGELRKKKFALDHSKIDPYIYIYIYAPPSPPS